MAKQKKVNMKKAFAVILIFISSLQLRSQVPDDFRFLDHELSSHEISDIRVLDDQIITIGKGRLDGIKFNYKFRNLMGGGSDYKFIAPNDTLMYYATWNYNCTDCFGLSTFSEKSGQIERENYEDIDVIDVIDVTYDTLGGWWCLDKSGRRLLYLKDMKILSKYELNKSNSKLYTSCNGDIYFVTEKGLEYFNGTEFENRPFLPSVSNLQNYEGYNYLLNNELLYKFDCDFDKIVQEWQLPKGDFVFDNLNILGDGKVSIAKIFDKRYEISIIDKNSELVNTITGIFNKESETIYGIKPLNESKFIVYGEEQFKFRSHNFYRIEDTASTINYPEIDLVLNDFNIEFSVSELIYEESLDSLIQSYRFSASVDVINSEDERIYPLNIYSNAYNAFFLDNLFTTSIRHNYATIPPKETINLILKSQDWAPYDEIVNLSISAAGANYKYLKNPNTILRADLVTNTNDNIIQNFDLFPNPVSNALNVDIKHNSLLRIFNTDGKVIKEQIYSQGGQKIDISHLQKGTYFLFIKNEENKCSISKFIKI